ncbi:TonB dependent receptor [compost metagenome]
MSQGGYAYNYNFPTDAFSYNNLEEGQALLDGKAYMDSYKEDNKLIGFFGRGSYSFDNKYHLLASVRREGSSRFGDNYKWGTFPSVSAGWTISNESFLKDVSVVNNLKLRAGYGETGIIPNSSYMSQTLLNYEGYFYNNGAWVQGLVPASNPNPDLRWEKSQEINLGVDFSLLDHRISGSVDVYHKKTKDMLWDYNVPVPPYLYGVMTANVGKMENKGIEILLNTVPVKIKDFEWDSSMTFSHNENELTSLSNDLYEIEGNYINVGNTGDPISFSTHRLEVGQSIGNFWGLKSVDITDDGKWIIETKDGTRKTLNETLYNDDNKQYLGNGIPKFNAGWTNTFKYKSFDLGVVLVGAFGFQILNYQRMFYENPTINYNMLDSSQDLVYGKAKLNYSQTYVSYYIEDGDYVKLDNVTFGYNLDVKNLKFLNSARVYASGSNLATFTDYKGIDPEIAGGNGLTAGNDSRDKYPTTRTFTLGINVNF